MEIRPLHDGDDRSTFRSGHPDLDRFLHQFAGQNQFRHHIGVTYVAIAERRVLGYATVAAGHLEVDDLPAVLRKKLPTYPLPILRLARLAVDESARDIGLGSQLLRYVLRLALRMSEDVGCVGLVVDAKPDAVGWYARYGFVALDLVEGESDARPRPTPLFLPLSAVRRTLDPS
jgi:GNAT superfamily N-acetyltransferase